MGAGDSALFRWLPTLADGRGAWEKPSSTPGMMVLSSPKRGSGPLEDAEWLGFVGSPTVLVNGIDPFARDGSPEGLACRVDMAPEGLAGSPTVDQLMEVLR